MQKTTKPLSPFSAALLVFIIANPTLWLIDIFPDFIACFIIANSLIFYADRAPFFSEARDGFIKAAILNLLRGPAFILAAMVKSKNVMDNDMMILLTFVFAIFECVILIGAVSNLFSAIFHIGMRGEKAAISPFKVFGRTYIRPETLKLMTYIFIVFRAAATALPEMLRLSRDDAFGPSVEMFNSQRLYLYLTVVLIPMMFILGIALSFAFSKYIKAIASVGSFSNTADGLLTPGARAELDKKNTAKGIKLILTVLMIAVALTADIRFDELSMIDIIPNFAFGIALIIALSKFSAGTKKKTPAMVCVSLYTAASAISCITEFNFLDTYGYSALDGSGYGSTRDFIQAQSAYKTVMNLSFIECVLLFAAIGFVTYSLICLLKEHASFSIGDNDFSQSTMKYHKEMRIKLCIFAALGMISGLMKFLYIVFNYYTKTSLVNVDTGLTIASEGLVPWFGTAVFITWIIHLGYSIYLFASLKEEVDLKYS